jgi:hypothetical protein
VPCGPSTTVTERHNGATERFHILQTAANRAQYFHPVYSATTSNKTDGSIRFFLQHRAHPMYMHWLHCGAAIPPPVLLSHLSVPELRIEL